MADTILGTVDLRPALRKVGSGPKRARDLTLEEAREAAGFILSGQASPAQIGALLLSMRVKGESPEELAGFTLAVRDHCLSHPALPAPLINCAAAYDGRVRTAPVGVAAAIVASRAGVHSLFHGVRGLGRAGIVPEDLLKSLAGPGKGLPRGTGYLNQADYCPALANLLPLRNELGLRTVFNTAEKLIGFGLEGTGERVLLAGVFHGNYMGIVASAAALLGIRRAVIIQGLEGSDDLPVTRDSIVYELEVGEIRQWSIELATLGIQRCPASALECRGLPDALALLHPALRGDPGPVGEALALNTGLRLFLARKVGTLAEGVVEARRLIGE